MGRALQPRGRRGVCFSGVVNRGIRETGPDLYEITSEVPTPTEGNRAWYQLKRAVLGPSLSSGRERTERLGWTVALAVLGADAIASSVYGPEEMLRMLSNAGVPVIRTWAAPLGAAIVALLAVLAISYWQTIEAYPNGAGGYIVASDNLGRLAGLASAAALLVDYTLDVSVSVASGIQTITSTLSMLAPYRVVLALAALGLITLANLRGIRTAGALMSVPIYIYVVGSLGVVGLGIYHWATGTLPPYMPPAAAQELLSSPAETFGLFLLLRAFSSGAVALTGVEAISNGVPYFKPPETANAQRTLAALAVLFGALLLGLSFLAGVMGVVPDPTETETVHSQITRTLLGEGPLHIIVEASALLLLVLAADTGFADFPRLLSLLANDGVLPGAFAIRGSRLAFSNGIMLVAAISAILIVAFRGSVSALIPLFTVGAFGTFTLSQAGMARHWWRKRSSGWQWRMAVNGFGAAVTTVVLAVVIISKFAYGAWIVVMLLPVIVLMLSTLSQHHDRVSRQLRIGSARGAQRVLDKPLHQHVLIMAGGIDKAVLHAVAYARSIEGDVEAVHITDDPNKGRELYDRWNSMGVNVRLVVLHSPVRSTSHALMRYLDHIQEVLEPHSLVTVVLPEVQPTRWWHPLIHNYFAWRLKWTLLFRPDTAVTSVPYTVRD
jgi:amino acid transporter